MKRRIALLLSIGLFAPSIACAQSVAPHNHAPTPPPNSVAPRHAAPPATPLPRRSPGIRRTAPPKPR